MDKSASEPPSSEAPKAANVQSPPDPVPPSQPPSDRTASSSTATVAKPSSAPVEESSRGTTPHDGVGSALTYELERQANIRKVQEALKQQFGEATAAAASLEKPKKRPAPRAAT